MSPKAVVIKPGQTVRVGKKAGIIQSSIVPLSINLKQTLDHFRRKRINVPRYVGKIHDAEKGTFEVVSRVGTRQKPIQSNTLNEFIKGVISRQESSNKESWGSVTKVLSSTARTMAQIHQEGYAHNHPHFKNFVIRKNQSFMIDFKYLTKREKINWNNPSSVYEAFFTDYHQVKMSFELLKKRKVRRELVDRWTKYFFEKLVSRYPMSIANKNELRKKIDKGQPPAFSKV